MEEPQYKILLVEDNKVDQMAFERMVSEENLPYQYEVANSVSQTRDILNNNRFDAIICDYNLGDGTGLDVIEFVEDTPFIFVTGAGDEAIAIKAMKNGASDYLVKDPQRNYLKILPLVVDSAIRNKTAADNLRKTHAQNQQLLSTIPLILIGISPDYQITHWNKAAQQAFGIAADDVITKPFLNCGIKWDWNKIANWITDFHRLDSYSTLENIPYQKPDGKTGCLNIKLSPFTAEPKDQSGFLFLAEDTTQRKILEDQVSKAQKFRSMGQLATGIANEIREPIHTIAHNARFLQGCFNQIYESLGKDERSQAGELSERVKSILGGMLTEIERIGRVIEAMTEFAPTGDCQHENIDINKAVENIVMVTRHYWKDVTEIVTDFDTKLPLLQCPADTVNQLIFDLLTNAADAIAQKNSEQTDDKGLITIRTSQHAKWVQIRITDTGVGIPDEIADRIFEPFFSTKELGRSMGQGLAICRSLVDRLGGMLTFESELGQGTAFTVHLNVAEKPAEVETSVS